MSHIVTVATRVHDPVAVAAACQRLNLPAPIQGTTELFSGQATGLVVKLPGWEYPAVIDALTGTVKYDNYGGAWGDQAPARPLLADVRGREGQAGGQEKGLSRERTKPSRRQHQGPDRRGNLT